MFYSNKSFKCYIMIGHMPSEITSKYLASLIPTMVLEQGNIHYLIYTYIFVMILRGIRDIKSLKYTQH